MADNAAVKEASPFDFSGATALVVGGATGLGFVMAEALLAHGATVCIASRTEANIKDAASQLAARFDGRCMGISTDITDEASVTRLVERLGDEFKGSLNIAINSAGTNTRNPIESISLEEWEHIQRTNITGAFLFRKRSSPSSRQLPGRD